MNNVYVRGNTSIKSISLTRLFLILPLIIYGIYKNGIFLYMNDYVGLLDMFRPIILILIGAFIGAIVNIIYEYIIKRRKESLINTIFSSFHVEYGVILACISSINTNILAFTICVFFIFLISKFLNNRINIIAITFIVIYWLMTIKNPYTFSNIYELSKNFSLNLMDYLTGRAAGGIASTHIILLMVSLVGLHISNTNKSEITIYTCISYALPAIIYAIIKHISIVNILFLNNYMFIFTFVATDSVTSCYTTNGKKVYGILVGLLTFGFYFANPIIAPFISITIVSLLNNLIDRKVGMFINKQSKIKGE